MRITRKVKNQYIPFDEHFNKHIFFHSNGIKADITYTGVAQWTKNGKTVKLYDVISGSLVNNVSKNLSFSPLSLELIKDIFSATTQKLLKDKYFGFELHILGYHEKLPIPWIAVISTYRKIAPWNQPGELEWQYTSPFFNIFIKAAEEPDVILGGVESAVNIKERQTLISAIRNGANAFNVSNLSSLIIENASKRTSAIGPRSVSMLMPKSGYIDSNLWDKSANGIIAFLPRMVFPNGNIWGPFKFPADLSLITNGHLPKQSLFFKSIIYKNYKRTIKRRIFRHRKGDLIPGIMGLLQLTLYGSVAEGYTDFGIGNEEESEP